MAKLSSLPTKTNSSSAPPSAPRWVSQTLRSKSTMSSTGTESSLAMSSRRAGWCFLASGGVVFLSSPSSPSPSLFFSASPSPSFSFFFSFPSDIAFFTADASTGTTCCCLFGLKPPSASSRWRWIASIGTRSSGRSTATSRASIRGGAAAAASALGSEEEPPPLPFSFFLTRTRPATVRSRSNHVVQRPPP